MQKQKFLPKKIFSEKKNLCEKKLPTPTKIHQEKNNQRNKKFDNKSFEEKKFRGKMPPKNKTVGFDVKAT